ncbi:hypothetical protein D3OALGA1CA_614 [Olavius algarvensis associated proteobacterium Delta 3]|nr:hypothetical protein D3OALGA1CA_614 [Olavius algarvensis associated proteobacterium Delta 3]
MVNEIDSRPAKAILGYNLGIIAVFPPHLASPTRGEEFLKHSATPATGPPGNLKNIAVASRTKNIGITS